MTLGLVASASGAAPTSYVAPSGSDTAACTQAAPCKTFDRAYRAASAGSEVEIAGGTYGGQDFNGPPAKATSERIVFRPAAGATVKIGYLGVSNTDNVEIRGMETDGWGVTDGSTNVILRDVTIFDERNGGYFGGAHDTQIIGGEIGRIDPGDGIHFNNAGGNTNTNITIDGLYMHDLTRNLDPSYHTDCMQTGDVAGLLIRNARFVNCGTQGIFLNPYNGGVTKDITIDNVWFGPAQLGYNSLYVGGATNVTVRNNSFTQSMYVSATAVNVRMISNIFAAMDAYTCQSNASNSAVYDYNMSQNACSGATHHTVNAGLSSQFVSATSSPSWALNLRLKAGAAAIDKGSPTGSTTTDYDGHARPAGLAPDAGADEYGSTGGSTPPPPTNVAPDTSISAGPTGSTTATTASFSFSASDDSTPAGSLTYECSLDGGAWSGCSSAKAYSNLTVGSHSFSVRATDTDGATDATPATRSWTITSSGSATTLFGNENVESLADRLIDGQAEAWPFTAATAGTAATVSLYVDPSSTASGAELGIYADNAGVPGTILGQGTLTSPTAGWNTAVVPGFSVTAGSQYWIAIFGTGSGELRFRTHPTGGDCLARLSATNTLSSLPGSWSGTGTASECPVSAYVTAGSGSPPPADTVAPDTSISSAPSGSTTSTSASFSFTGSDNVTAAGSLTFECQLDTGAWGGCTSPKAYSGLGVGAHTFRVRAKDSAGNVDTSPATASWTTASPPPPADTTAPDTTITSAPATPSSATSATFAFSGSDNVTPAGSLTFECSLDLAAWAACASPKNYSGLAVGNHNVRVRAKDAAGNVDASAASFSWTIVAQDTTAPDTTITSGPDGLSLSTTASFTFTGSDNVTASDALTFACSLDGGPWLMCTSPQGYDNLSLLGHSFAVRATDAAGNIDPSPVVYSWSVAAPTVPGTVEPTDPTGTPTTPPATTPAVTLGAPTEGSTFSSRLAYSATAVAPQDATVKRVEFWFDANRLARDTAAPYTYSWKVPSSTKSGPHTVSARAYDSAGRVASVATTVMRTTGATAAAKPVAASLMAISEPSGGTELAGRTRSSRPMRVELAPCSGERKTVRPVQVTLRPESGKLSGRHRTGRLCVVGLIAQP
ncbi:MAG TPA: Ig-like domain-containing protein [Baekduia sp.]|uniref:Ig-like domain-containing protein n=1 Tax=Baekduia sp. TaxID=2600305 RepID=UPI002BA132E2|nr:Ig-like domain-containing protein [Baekduia sp.]HMJ33998.1 Ig-like domain-containing protein [Baekduia sp.]